MQLKPFRKTMQTLLTQAGIENAAFDESLLTAHALGVTREQLVMNSDGEITPVQQADIETLIIRRAAHEPVHRIIGSREFWGLNFNLNAATLEPRPDSETLVNTVLRHIAMSFPTACVSKRDWESGLVKTINQIPAFAGMTTESVRILDLGTGTGCLLLSLLHELPQAIGMGVDISPLALLQAAQNAASLNLSSRVTSRGYSRISWCVSNWFENVSGMFDIIISNPPYIGTSEKQNLAPDVLNYDPATALFAGEDGLAAYRALIPAALSHLNQDGVLVLEIGFAQAQAVTALLLASGFQAIEIEKDFAGHDRVLVASSGIAR